MSAKIIGTGSYLPEKIVHNTDLEKIMETSDEWIKSRTGISSRHIATSETTTSMALEASKKALENAGISAEELDMIIVGTVSPDCFFPSTACQLQEYLGAVNAVAFDISAACSAFLFGMQIVDNYMKSGTIRYALVVGAETLSKIMNWDDRGTCVLFGDGAGAAILKNDPDATLYMAQGSDGTGGKYLTCENRPVNNPFTSEKPKDLAYTTMDGQAVYRFAVKTIPKCINEVTEMAGWSADEVDCFALHQANLRIIEAAAKRLGQPMEKFPTIIEECGNISAGSVPILLDTIHRSGQIKRGDKLVLAGFGAGLTWGAAAMIW